MRATLLAVVLLLLAACPPRVTPTPLGGLRIQCAPADAQLFVDDGFVGTVASLRGRVLMLRQGLRRVELRREGYFAHYADLTIGPGQRQLLRVRLRPEPH